MCWELVQSKPNKNSKGGQVPAVVEPGPIGTDYGGGPWRGNWGMNSLRNSRHMTDGPLRVERSLFVAREKLCLGLDRAGSGRLQ